jgi:predicted DNA-binding transcriptional regulator YafY
MINYNNTRSQVRAKNTKPLPNIGRVQRCVMLIAFLTEWRTTKEISNLLAVSKRTVYRYLDMLTQLGFVVTWSHRKGLHLYRIENTKQFFKLE